MLWLKAFHIIAVVCWFAGLFYLPRLFVYHAMAEDQLSKDRFKIMEHKLFWGITTPSAIATVILGLWLLANNFTFFMSFWWMQVKLGLVVILLAYHFICWRLLIEFREDRNSLGQRFYRWFNEFPVLLLISIVLLIVVKPAGA
jgi:protoporphyrinogen IX oxidase